jgi:hypothetical protein
MHATAASDQNMRHDLNLAPSCCDNDRERPSEIRSLSAQIDSEDGLHATEAGRVALLDVSVHSLSYFIEGRLTAASQLKVMSCT